MHFILIKKLCPNGVEFQKLSNKELFKFYYGKGNKIPDDIGGIYDVYGANGVVSHINEYNCEDVSIIGHIGAVGMVNRCKGKCFVTYNGTIAEVVDKTKVNSQYFYYVLTTLNLPSYKKGSQPFLSVSDFEKIKIAVPPFEIQCEIVNILDNFTLLSAELSAQLSAELKARQKQFSYYREELISNSNGKKYRLDDIVEIYLGLTHTPKYVENGIKFISAQNTSNDYLDLDNVKYISRQEFDSITDNAKPKRDDVLFTRVGSNLGHPVIVETDEKLCIFVSLGFLRVKDKTILSNKYLKHWINTEDFWKQVRKNVHGSAKVNLNTGWLKNFEITIPSLKEQNKIIEIMDKLEVITNDISEELPAEIDARRKQYEYYRDRLLTFKELKVNEG